MGGNVRHADHLRKKKARGRRSADKPARAESEENMENCSYKGVGSELYCPYCGLRGVRSEDTYCSECGSKVQGTFE